VIFQEARLSDQDACMSTFVLKRMTMDLDRAGLGNVTIQYDGNVRGIDDIGIQVFKVEYSDKIFWFEFDFYNENTQDFLAVIGNFGLTSKFSAGSSGSLGKFVFTNLEGKIFEQEIINLLMGPPENKILPRKMDNNRLTQFFSWAQLR
jgi:hypothetical protein